MKKIINYILHIINILILLFIVSILFISIFQPGLIKTFIECIKEWIKTLGNWNYLIAFTSAFVESFPVIGTAVPGQNVMLLVGGFFGGLGKIQLIIMIIVSIMGALLGNWVGYLLGKKYGEKFFLKYGDYVGVGKTELKYLKGWIKKYGGKMIIIGKFHNMLRAFVPFIAGSMNMKNKKFIIHNIIGSIIRAVTIILIGVIFVNSYEIILNYIGYILLGIMLGIALYIYLFKKEEFKKYLKEKEAEIDEKLK